MRLFFQGLIRTKALLFVFLACACATPTPYVAASKSESPGYRDQKIEENRYRISFRGNEITPRETVEIYILHRAAELTLENGADYFIVSDKDTEAHTSYDTFGPSMYGGYGYNRRRYGSGIGMGWSQSIQSTTKYEANLMITTHKGPTPKDNPRAYDAKDVIKNTGPQIILPPEPKAK